MDKILKIVIILVCVLGVLLAIVGWVFLSFLFSLPDTRGLRLNPYYTKTNYAKYLTVENTGKETLFISRFYNEHNQTIYTSEFDQPRWWDRQLLLPSGIFVTLILDGLLFYSHEIYVEFSDGYKCKLGNI
jgi:hypothetical protein